MEIRPGTLAQHLIIIGDAGCIYQKRAVSPSLIQWNFSAFYKTYYESSIYQAIRIVENWPYNYKTSSHWLPLKNSQQQAGVPVTTNSDFLGGHYSTATNRDTTNLT